MTLMDQVNYLVANYLFLTHLVCEFYIPVLTGFFN